MLVIDSLDLTAASLATLDMRSVASTLLCYRCAVDDSVLQSWQLGDLRAFGMGGCAVTGNSVLAAIERMSKPPQDLIDVSWTNVDLTQFFPSQAERFWSVGLFDASGLTWVAETMHARNRIGTFDISEGTIIADEHTTVIYLPGNVWYVSDLRIEDSKSPSIRRRRLADAGAVVLAGKQRTDQLPGLRASDVPADQTDR